MKIAFVGKGGSGKTSICGMLIYYLLSQHKAVLAIDSDINQHLGIFLDFTQEELGGLPYLGNELDSIANYILAERPIKRDKILRTTPPSRLSTFLRPFETSPFYNHFAINRSKLRFMAVGMPDNIQIGEKCYHSNMGLLSFVLNHTIDKSDEYIVVDLTAGIDTLISGIFISYDIVFVIVEPTLQSLTVYRDYKNYIEKLGTNTVLIPVANKIFDEKDVSFIEDTIKEKIKVSLVISAYIQTKEKGKPAHFNRVEPVNIHALSTMKEIIDTHKKDWNNFYNNLVFFHTKKAQTRPDKEELLKQIDIEFNIQDAVQQVLV